MGCKFIGIEGIGGEPMVRIEWPNGERETLWPHTVLWLTDDAALRSAVEAAVEGFWKAHDADPDGAPVPLPKRNPLPATERVIPAFPEAGLKVAQWRGW